MVEPYYKDNLVEIYNCDCREILASLPKVDLVLTDPPYGIADIWQGGFSAKHGWGKAKGESELRNQWDSVKPDAELLSLVVNKGTYACIWGGNYFPLPPSRGWLVWSKPERGFTLSEAELAWTNRDTVIRVFDGKRSDVIRRHPTQKTLAVMLWSLGQFAKADTVLDPFMGSGTTLVAAKELNRKAIGIETEERYCEIAARRCESIQAGLFETPIVQPHEPQPILFGD